MKIFISHSSKDKWAAGVISDELRRLGADTFLDEKDIKTGERFDDSIQQHLSNSDEVLLLLSPASATSHWVLVEVGIAMALKKPLAPILFYLGANEIPDPLTKNLARDINDIGKYYDEVKGRLAGIKAAPSVPAEPSPRLEFKVGDSVRMPLRSQPDALRRGITINWRDDMDAYLGKMTQVVKVDRDQTVQVKADRGKNWWAFEWLEKA